MARRVSAAKLGGALLVLALVASARSAVAPNPVGHWVRSWAVALMAPEEFDYYPGLARSFQAVTVRQVIVGSLAGPTLRVSISNEYGSKPLVIGRAHIARQISGPRIDIATDRELTFSGQRSVIVPVGAALMSDAVELRVIAGSALAVSLYLPQSTAGSTATVHEEGWRMGYVSPRGDFTSQTSFPVEAELGSYFYIAALDVSSPTGASGIVALGDSITDGTGATRGADRTWPNELARRLRAAGVLNMSVINMGIGGNRLLHPATGPSALSRIDRDVFAVPGVRFLVVLEGINDIAGWPEHPEEDVSDVDIEAALRQIIDQAHVRGLRVFGGTITPTLGCPDCGGTGGERTRQAVNAWIRGADSFDGVFDFDRAVRDPLEPRRLRSEFDSGDHLHPSDAGYRAMAEAIDLSAFRTRQ